MHKTSSFSELLRSADITWRTRSPQCPLLLVTDPFHIRDDFDFSLCREVTPALNFTFIFFCADGAFPSVLCARFIRTVTCNYNLALLGNILLCKHTVTSFSLSLLKRLFVMLLWPLLPVPLSCGCLVLRVIGCSILFVMFLAAEHRP